MNNERQPEGIGDVAELLQAVPEELVSTGSAGLGEMLSGGVARGSTVYVCGSPGSGKTILAEQMAYASAAAGINALYMYLAGFSESIVNRVRNLQSFEFFDAGALNVSVAYHDIFPVIRAAQSTDLLYSITSVIQKQRAGLIVIDSIRTVLERLEEFEKGQKSLRQLTEFVSEQSLVAVLVGEYQQDDIVRQPQFAFADGVILLTAPYEAPDGKRHVRVLKMRGVNHSPEGQEVRITSAGLQVHSESSQRADARMRIG